MKRRERAWDEATIASHMEGKLKGEEREFCPLCLWQGVVELKEEHEFGSTTATEYLGLECLRCGRLADCADCGGWRAEYWDGTEPIPPEVAELLCSCKASVFVLGDAEDLEKVGPLLKDFS